MKIIRFRDAQGRTLYGRYADARFQQAEVLQGSLLTGLKPTNETVAVQHLLAPLDPVNLFCIGINYRHHAEEAKMEIPQRPILFLKSTNTVNPPNAPVVIPSISYKVDWEGELAVVIGKPALNVSEADALDYVLGYTCANDVSARDWQLELDRQWCRGKCFDSFAPLGPVLVTADEIANPNALRLRTRVNGKTMQDSSTGDMIFGVRQLVSYLSQSTTLVPGSVILTGTPAGVGMGMNPPRFLVPGDECEVEIEGIGVLRSPFISDQSASDAA